MSDRRTSRAHPSRSRHSRSSSSGSNGSNASDSSASTYSGRSSQTSYSSDSAASSATSQSSFEDRSGQRPPFFNSLSQRRVDVGALRDSIARLPTDLNADPKLADPRVALDRAVVLCRDLTIAAAAGRRSGMDNRLYDELNLRLSETLLRQGIAAYVDAAQTGQVPLQNIGKRFFLPDYALLKDMLPGSIVEVHLAAPLQHPRLRPMTGGPEKIVWSLVNRGHERIGRNAEGKIFRA